MLPTFSLPLLDLPAGATDCHVHVFDPARFAFDPARSYTPPRANASDLAAFLARLRVQRVVLVQPSCYGTDNRALLDALDQCGTALARGIVVLDCAGVDAGLLRDLHAQGVRGVRLNIATQRPQGLHAVRAQLDAAQRAIAPLGWSLQLHCPAGLIAALLPQLSRSPCRLVLDHFAGLRAASWSGEGGGWHAVRTLLDEGGTYVKLSAPYRIASDPALAAPLARALLRAAPQRMLWGSDWPHTGGAGVRQAPAQEIEPFRPADAGAALDLLADWAGDAALRQRVLVGNPQEAYGFDPQAPTSA